MLIASGGDVLRCVFLRGFRVGKQAIKIYRLDLKSTSDKTFPECLLSFEALASRNVSADV
jgi:hypothetical protein